MKILPGITFSWRRAIGLTAARQRFARATGVPTTKQGIERKIGASVIKFIGRLFK